jgi:hypothetical protein
MCSLWKKDFYLGAPSSLDCVFTHIALDKTQINVGSAHKPFKKMLKKTQKNQSLP